MTTNTSSFGLRVRNVNQNFKKNHILHDIDFEIPDGEFVVFVGPSGCGKTTLLRLIAGLDQVTAGEIYIKDRLVNKIPPDERNIAMVFQDYALYPHMTVRGNLEFGLKNRKIPKDEIERRVAKAAETLQIQDYLDRRPQNLSGGQRQRVAIGRALVRQPDLFLFDEPLSNLDAKLRGEMRIELATLQRNLGTTSVYVTHDQVEAMTLADRIIVLKAGRVQQIGTPMDIYERPANQFVASFIGSPSMNFFEGTLRIDSSGGRKTFNFGTESIDLSTSNTPAVEGNYTMGIRPEVIELADDGHKHQTDFEAQVLTVELHGYDAHVIARVGRQQVVFRSSNEKELLALKSAKKGKKLGLYLNRHSLHWFEATGDNRRLVILDPKK